MDLEWRKHFIQAGDELRIIAVYSIIIAVFTLTLQFIQWDYDLLISVIHLLVLFAVAHAEDRVTVHLPWPELMTRLGTAVLVYLASRKAALTLKANYLSGDLSRYDSDSSRPTLISLTILVEYLDTWRFVSSARIYIVAIVLIMFAAPALSSVVHSGLTALRNGLEWLGLMD